MASRVPQQRQYRLYLDESGDPVYEMLHTTSHRFLGLVGIWFEQSKLYPEYECELRSLKARVFGREDIVLHRKDILQKRGPFSVLGRDGMQQKFDAGWLGIITSSRYRCSFAVIDKLEHIRKYKKPYHPYNYLLGVILDRYCGWLRSNGAVGDILAEARNPPDNDALQGEYARILAEGTLMFPKWKNWHAPVLTTTEIKFRTKGHYAPGLELSDSLAFPLRQWCLVHKGHADDPGEVFGKRVVRACAPRLHRCPRSGRIDGFGSIWLPKDEDGPEIIWPVQ